MKMKRYFSWHCFLSICLIAVGGLFLICCDGGSGGGGDNNDDDGIPTEIIGVWKMTSKYRYSYYEEACVNESYPITDAEGVVISIFIELDAEGNASKYVKFENMPGFLNDAGYYDGLYHCSAENKAFSVSGDVITDSFNEKSNFSVSGDILTIIPEENITGCTEERKFIKDSETSISGAVENCDLAIDGYDDEDSFYEIFMLEDHVEI